MRLGLWLPLWIVLVAARAAAEDAPPAPSYDNLIREAIQAQEHSEFERAHALFSQAHEQRPNARTLRGMGVASYQGGHFMRAVAELEAALVHAERPLEGELREAALELLQRSRAQLGSVVLEVSPPETRVSVDGSTDGRSITEPVWLDPGQHTLHFSCPGYGDQELGIDLAAAGRETLRVRLQANAAPRVMEVSAPIATAPSPPVREQPRKDAAAQSHRRRRIAMWTSAGLSAASGATSLALWLGAQHRIDSVRAACGPESAPRCSETQRAQLEASANLTAFELGIDVTLGLAVGSALAAGVLWYADLRVMDSLALTAGPRGFSLHGRF